MELKHPPTPDPGGGEAKGMRVGDLFSGIGGFSLAASRVWGWDCVQFQVEIDPWCRRVLAKHWPDVRRYGDIKEVTGVELGAVDVLCGGFPCQDISTAGKGEGISGERSGLWSEYVRLIGEIRPRYVVVENVAALLFRGMGRVLGDLAEIGYDAEWHCIPSAYVGAPHIRDRVWLLAHTGSQSRSLQRYLVEECGLEAKPRETSFWGSYRMFPEVGSWRDLSPTQLSAVSGVREPIIAGVVDGFPGWVDRLRGCGNAIVPQVAELLFRWIDQAEREASR